MKRMAFLVSLLIISATTGQAADPTGDIIKIGMVNDQTGSNKESGRGMKAGVQAYFMAVNEKGGVNGRRLELVTADDRYNPDATVDGVLRLIEQEHIFALVGTVGTSSGISILPIVKEYRLPFVAPRSGAASFRTPVIREVINLRASHQEELDRLVDLLVQQRGARRLAVFYQNDAFGTEIVDNTEKALKRLGLTLAAKASFERGTTLVEAAVTTIFEAKPDAVIVAATSAPGGTFIRKFRFRGGQCQIATGSFAGGINLVLAGGQASEGLIMSQVVPHLDSELPLVRECREAMAKNPEEVGFNAVSLEGCVAAKSMVMALERAGSPPTREGFLKAYEGMKDADMGGIKLTFSQENHQGQSSVYMQIVQGNKLAPLKSLKD
jgi:branched-chain amino acid transport system substrate-binding protein